MNGDFTFLIAVVAGQTSGVLPGQTSAGGTGDAFVRKYDASGTEVWTRQFGTDVDDDPGAIAADGTGVIVVGTTRGALTGANEPDDPDAFVRRYDRSGNVVFTRQFGTPAGDSATAVSIDGHLIASR